MMELRVGAHAAYFTLPLGFVLAVLSGCSCSDDPIRSLRIDSPTSGSVLGASDDEDPSSVDTIEFTVIVDAVGLDGREVELYPNADSADTDSPLGTATVSAGMAIFESVSFEFGAYRLLARSGAVDSPPVGIVVGDADGCAAISITYVDPAPEGARVTLGPGEDTDGEMCGATFETSVTVSTNAADGSTAQLFVNGTPRATATVMGTVARFDDVGLDNRGDTSNTIAVEIVDSGLTCRESFPVPVFVDCSGVSCALTFPNTSSAYLNSADDMSMDPGFQTNFEVTSDADAIGLPVQLSVDGAELTVDATSFGAGALATFTSIDLPEGRVAVQAECTDSAGNTTRSGIAEWIVDITPCTVTITAPDATRAMSPFTDSDDVDTATPGIQIDASGSSPGTDCTDFRVGICSSVAAAPFVPLASADFDAQVTLDSSPTQQLCAEVRDVAGNIGQATRDLTVRTMGPQLAFDSPAMDTRYNTDGTGGRTADLSRPSDTCEAAIVVNCTDVGVPVTLETTSTGTMLVGGTATCTAMAGLPAPFLGQATFPMASLPSRNDGSALSITARQTADTLTGTAALSLFSDCDLPNVSIVDPVCGGPPLRPSTQDENSTMPGFQYGVDVLNSNTPKPCVDLTIRQAGGGSTVYMANSCLPSGGPTTTFTDANFASGGSLELVGCATDNAMNTFCTAACPVVVADVPQVSITAPADGTTLDGTTPADCDTGTAGYQVRVTASVVDAVDGSTAAVTIGGATVMTTVMGGAVSACVDANDGRAVTVRVTVTDTTSMLMGSAMVTVDIDTVAPTLGITDLAAATSNRRRGRVSFTWTAVADGAFALDQYELRCARTAITNETEWTAATPRALMSVPAAAGTAEAEVVSGFRAGVPTFCMLRGLDPAGRINPLGNSVDATVNFLQQAVTAASTAQLGLSIAPVGDVNGDGNDDVLVGAPVLFSGVATDSRALLYFGSTTAPPTTAGVTIIGTHLSFAAAMTSIGDFNGDTRPDFAIGERGASGAAGRVYVFFGRPATSPWPATIDLRSGGCPADLCFFGMGGFATMGWSVAGADFNGDGNYDLIMGAPFANSNTGRVYVILGGTGFTAGSTFDIPVTATITPAMTQPDGFYVNGAANELVGTGLTSPGSLSGLRQDVCVGGSGNTIAGTVHQLAGRAYPPASFGLQQIAAGDLVQIDSATSLGERLTALDYDGDSRIDVVAQAATDPGFVYLYPGSGSGFSAATRVQILNDLPGGTRTADGFGTTLGLGWHPFLGPLSDIDRDGRHDLLAGARQRGTEAGGIELYYGANPIGTPRRTTVDAFIQPTPPTPAVERTAGTAGDINGDGFDDMIVGDPSDNSNAGRFFFVY